MFSFVTTNRSKLNFEKRVIGTSSKLQRDAYTGAHVDCTRSCCNTNLPVSCGCSSPPLGSTLRSTHSSGMEVLTADPPLLLDSGVSSSLSHRRRRTPSFFLCGEDDCRVEDDSVVVEAGDSTTPVKYSPSPESFHVRVAPSSLVSEAFWNASAGGVFTTTPIKLHDDRPKRGCEKELDGGGSKCCSQWRRGSLCGVTHSSITRSQDSEEKGPMHVSLAHKALIGKGSFGVVFQAMDRDTNHIIAVKEITFVNGAKSKALEAVRKELALLKLLDHPHIVKCLGEECDEGCLRIYMEYVSGGSISSVLRIFGPFQEKQASIYTRQMLEGLSYLHSKNIMHRDLKGDNLLVDPNGTLKISDFGTAKDLLDSNAPSALAGTAYFMSPEVILSQNVGLKSDVWSVGCCVIEMLTGTPPFSKVKTQYATMMLVAETQGELFPNMLPKGYHFSSAVMAFLQRCLWRDPSARSTAQELLSDPWILNPVEGSSSTHCRHHSSNGATMIDESSSYSDDA
ncbi:putative protein kinase [Trypanosoma rangeli]|uniref:Protein kinase domain-containing protein n=1 Tax=Trypanosoma rangeli TaxID=5698 RepID=A0A422NFN4_TRYRA|nr:putative protein kinase [Trypanosoma rangeli]RNF04256.1 putative protein kinase [Trypanosoma rangeli]|eukprot:RNF04256.1 putative protein kinase [Trypanosoma rangeli]